MQALLVDTNVISFVFKNDPVRGPLYLPYLSPDRLLAVSFQTVAELYRWVEQYKWSQSKIDELESLLKNFIVPPYDNKLARIWAKIVNDRKQQGNQISCSDAWIAASALRHSLPLLTHNKKHFEGITDLEIISAPVEK